MSTRGGGRGRRGGRGGETGDGGGGPGRGRAAVPEHGVHRDEGGAGQGRGRGAAEPEHGGGGRGGRSGAGLGGRGAGQSGGQVHAPQPAGGRGGYHGGAGGGRGGPVEHSRGRGDGGGAGRGGGESMGQVHAPQQAGGRGGYHGGAGGGRGGRGDRGGTGRGGGESGGPFHAPQPVGGRGGYHGGVAQGRGPVAPTTAAEVAELSRHVERKMAVTEVPAPTPAQAPSAATTLLQGTAPPTAAGRLPPASSKALVFPARPGYGTVGRPCRVRANHFLVQATDKEIYHYDVTITPGSNSRERNRWIVNELVQLHKQHLNGRLPVYDGKKSLFTAGPLPFQSKQFALKLTNPDRANLGEKEYNVTIKDAAKIDLYSLQLFLAGRQRELPQNTIQALDIALRECPSASYVPISRSFFSQSFGHGGAVGNGVECWRGYYQSLRPTQMGLSLNIDISATAFYKAQPIIEFAMEYLNLRDASRRLSDLDRIKLKKALKGVKVVATHRRDISIRYRITAITSAPLNDLMFDQEGRMVSVVQYFKQQYNRSLKYTHWPCLQAGSDKRPIYLPMEVCCILEGQRYSRKLNERQVASILKMSCERPAQREGSILEVVSRNNYSNDNYAKEFGVKVSNQLALVDARVLPAPRLKYHDSGKEKICNPSIGQWNMINKRMVNGGSIRHWACLTFALSLHPNAIGMFCEDLVSMCNKIGIQMSTTPSVDIKQGRPDNLEASIRSIYKHSIEVIAQQGPRGHQLELLIIVLPDIGGSYGRIKRLCETELGIVTQCCAPRNVRKGGKQYLENLVLKINVKVGGRNTVLEDALNKRIPPLTDKPTIVFGADVTHPPAGESLSPSIAAVVASMDWPQVTKYKCLVSTQGPREEIINDLYTEVRDSAKGFVRGGMVRELLVSFYKSTGCKPHRIIFYRDGVSEGQFSQVLLYEMDAIRKACASLEEGYLPKVTFVVVQKRHHTRLFPEDHRSREQTDRSGNILPGTAVDTKICHPSEFDFYLCSHSGIQGTSRPAHYHVLFDENGFGADALQTLTYNLCYTYARCTRSVSIVPPAYYAHLGAFRARYYMEDEISDQDSSAVTSRSGDQPVPVKQLPRIKENVQEFMFYC